MLIICLMSMLKEERKKIKVVLNDITCLFGIVALSAKRGHLQALGVGKATEKTQLVTIYATEYPTSEKVLYLFLISNFIINYFIVIFLLFD